MALRLITGFHRGDDLDWVAELACGHQRHVRHHPPWEVHPWILDEQERLARIGMPLECRLCDTPNG